MRLMAYERRRRDNMTLPSYYISTGRSMYQQSRARYCSKTRLLRSRQTGLDEKEQKEAKAKKSGKLMKPLSKSIFQMFWHLQLELDVCTWWSADVRLRMSGPPQQAWQSPEYKKSGPAYGSVSDSIVIRLPPSPSSSSPNALRLSLFP